jgi:uncharacterized Ntn-hydrolase superfamily protein
MGSGKAALVVGRELSSGNTVEVRLDEVEVRQAMAEPIGRIVDAARRTLAEAPPELTHDVLETGMFLMGGGDAHRSGPAAVAGVRGARARRRVPSGDRRTRGRSHARAPRAVPDVVPARAIGAAVTFSIVAFDSATGDLGVAVASKFPCVGAVVPWARAGVGAVATQSWANTDFGPDGLQLMGGGLPAGAALDAVLEPDADREAAGGFVDAEGGVATFTGANCMDWAGVARATASPQGTSWREDVVASLADVFADRGDLCDRLLAALLAGDAAGGDRRGKQSAALLVVRDGGGYEGRNDRYIDLRVDDHPDAPAELARVFGVWDTTMLVRTDEPLGRRSSWSARSSADWRPSRLPRRSLGRVRRRHHRGAGRAGRPVQPGGPAPRRRDAEQPSRGRAPATSPDVS